MRHLFAFITLAAPSAAMAQTLDFEALQTTIPSFVRIDDVTGDPYMYSEDGFVVEDMTRSYGLYRWGIGTQQYTDNGSTNLYNNGPDAYTRVYSASGATFALTSIDLAELNGADRTTVNFTGLRSDGTTVTASFTIDGVPFYAETFSFPSTFQNLVYVEWRQQSPYHTFDNIVLNGGGGGFGLRATTSCPASGPASIAWAGGTPSGNVALVRANSAGTFTIPSGGCAGTQLGVSGGVALIGIYPSNPAGGRNLSFTLPAAACGKRIQAVDLSTCTPSNVVVVQ